MSSMWKLYVATVTDGQTQEAVAERCGLAQTTVSRWLRDKKLPTEAAKVAAFARGYDRNVLEAFVAAGMISEKEAVSGLDDEARLLLKRLARQMRAEAKTAIPSEPSGTIAAMDSDEPAGAPEDG